jgi:hypothetical protein
MSSAFSNGINGRCVPWAAAWFSVNVISIATEVVATGKKNDDGFMHFLK